MTKVLTSTMFWVAISIILLFVLFFYASMVRATKMKNQEEGVTIFGVKMTTTDFFSFISTCISYLMMNDDHTLDLHDFINPHLVDKTEFRDSCYFIERVINLYPIVACTYMDNGKFIWDEDNVTKKLATYQKQTQSDNYIIPLFDLSLIGRNKGLFSVATRYQQVKTFEMLMQNIGVNGEFTHLSKVASDVESILKDKEDTPLEKSLVVERVFDSARNTSVAV